MGCLTDIKYCKIKSSIIDTNNCLSKVYPLFNRLYKELLPGFCLVDNLLYIYSSCNILVKMVHLTTNVTLTEAKLF